jgi:hypothetical protein
MTGREERLMLVLGEVGDDLADRLGVCAWSLGVDACDHSHRRTADALHRRIPPEEIPDALYLFERFGGYCDCEVLLNALPVLLGEIDDREGPDG